MTALDKPDFTISVKYDPQQRGYVFSATFRDGDTILTHVEPWMLEAALVASQLVSNYVEKLEKSVLLDFAKQAQVDRMIPVTGKPN